MSSAATNLKNRQAVVSGPIVKTIIALAVPVTAGMLMEVALSVTDFYWVGKLGTSAQDAITTSMITIWAFFSVSGMIGIGVTALVSRHVGAQNIERAVHYIRQACWLAAIVGLVVTVAGSILTPLILRSMGAGEVTLAHGIPYLRIFFIFCLTLVLSETAFASFRASGDTRTPMKVGITVVLINMVLDPLFIFGYGPVPALGVAGAAMATAVAHVYGVAVIYVYVLKGRLGYRVTGLFQVPLEWLSMLKISRIGLPIASQNLVFVGVYWFLINYVHRFGEAAGAAMGVGNRMESISYLTCYGFSLAASTMVGQNLGARRPDRAAKCAWGAAGLGVAVTLVLSVLFIGIPRVIASIFTDDPTVLAIAEDYLIILGISQSAMAFEIILEGAFSGAGDTLPPMLVLLPGSLARIPLAWWLAFDLGWGVNGVWWTMTITSIAKAIVLVYLFKRGRWKLKNV
ncbi:MAG: MATE family efflux transporter [candidate division Zixibacteria bacterium]|nr:MATE family efflux transporter [candidate division Zixibacteria bacterium]